MSAHFELRVVRRGDKIELCSPAAGSFTCALERGALLGAGQSAGVLVVLAREYALHVPAGVSGRIASSAPERVLAPVSCGDVLYELEPIAGESARTQSARASSNSGALVLRSTQSGRFYHRASPNDPPFVEAGAILSDGMPLGLIEVMKTFQHILYRSSGDLPARAKLVRMLAGDGADVSTGDPLAEFAAADR